MMKSKLKIFDDSMVRLFIDLKYLMAKESTLSESLLSYAFVPLFNHLIEVDSFFLLL